MAVARFVRVSVLAVLLGATAHAADAQSSFCRPVEYPGSVPGTTEALGINNLGTVVGTYATPDPISELRFHAFTLINGQYTSFDFQGAYYTTANGINDAGQIVGDGYGPFFANGYLLSGGQFSSIMATGDPTVITSARGINNAGTIIGYYHPNPFPGFQVHGFVLSGGGATTIDVAGMAYSGLYGISNSGPAAGSASDASGKVVAFRLTNGRISVINDPPGDRWSSVGGIDRDGKIAGAATHGGIILAGNRFSNFNCPDAQGLQLRGINDRGGMVGVFLDPNGVGWRAFYTPSMSFIDPVPDLLSGQTLTTNGEDLAVKGRDVRGAAADGVSIVVLRIPTANVGDQVTLSLLRTDNPQDPAMSSDEDGALGTPAHSCCVFQITVSSVSTSRGPIAFATYRAPMDFPRTAGVPAGGDASRRSRDVYVRFQSPGGGDMTVPLRLVRPPVALIHGLWGSSSTWGQFSPLVTGSDTSDDRFKVQAFSYDQAISLAGNGNPSYPQWLLWRARANSLGFTYNARLVLQKMEQFVKDFKAGLNPESISVAAIQVDVVAHSMGGDIARAMALERTYLQRNTFGQGIIHKMITIDTPHTGTPVATRLLLASPQEDNGCLRSRLALLGDFAFSSVTLPGAGVVSGAMGDLSLGSQALRNIAAQGQRGLFTAMIAGEYSKFSSLANSWGPSLCPSSPLAQALTPNGWPAVFTDDAFHINDGVVSLHSQGNGLSATIPPLSLMHSSALSALGFAPPSVLDADSTVPGLVIDLLNTPVTNFSSYPLINP
jgi:pimeloyl-ACP methyl ester carboxylesterase